MNSEWIKVAIFENSANWLFMHESTHFKIGNAWTQRKNVHVHHIKFCANKNLWTFLNQMVAEKIHQKLNLIVVGCITLKSHIHIVSIPNIVENVWCYVAIQEFSYIKNWIAVNVTSLPVLYHHVSAHFNFHTLHSRSWFLHFDMERTWMVLLFSGKYII